MREGAKITVNEKELVYIAASIAAGCKPCTDYHVKIAKESGCTDDEIKKAIAEAVCVRKSAAGIMEAHGLKKLGTDKDTKDCCSGETSRIKELICVAASYALSCTESLRKHIDAARGIGIADDEIKEVLQAAIYVKEKADSHVRKAAKRFAVDFNKTPEEMKDVSTCGGDENDIPGTCGGEKREPSCNEMMSFMREKFKSMISDEDCQKIMNKCLCPEDEENNNGCS